MSRLHRLLLNLHTAPDEIFITLHSTQGCLSRLDVRHMSMWWGCQGPYPPV